MKVIFHRDFYDVYARDPAAQERRLEAVMKVIEPHVTIVEAVPASEEQIAAVHTASHIEWVKRQDVYDIAALAAGGAIQAADLGMTEPCFALIRPPGHHASPGSAWGFCYFSNMAISIKHLLRKGAIGRAHVLDFDLHFGDGTENALAGIPNVTIHNPGGHDRESYLKEVGDALDRCQADVIGISAGFDNHEDDWGGVMATEDYREMGRMARDAAAKRGAGCFALLEGGYNHDVLGHNALALIKGLSSG